MTEENLWGELPVAGKVESPLSILRMQALALASLSAGRLVGRVFTTKARDGVLEHELRIVVPALENYSTTILFVRHGVLMYPAEVAPVEGHGFGVIRDGEEMKSALREVLQSERTRAVIKALLAQIVDIGRPDETVPALS